MNTIKETGFLEQEPGFATKAIHVGHNPDSWSSGTVVLPIVQSTTFKQDGPAQLRSFDYGRAGNPTRNALEDCLAALDNGKYGLCFASGCAATTTITALLSSGDHILCGDDLYGGTNTLFRNVFERMGIEISFVNLENPENIVKALTPKTKMVWIESPTNPLMQVTDIAAIANHLKNKPDVFLVVDNTFMTSYFQKPLELGADIVMYSLTKYMNGHTDVVMGAAITNSESLFIKLKYLQEAMGGVPSPFDCSQVYRSLKTLSLRMDRHMMSSIAIAKWLEKHEMVERVLHPGLPSHPQHELAKKQTYGCSGMLSFYIKGGLKQSTAFLKALKVFTLAESLGGFESLAELPSVMTHALVPEEQRKRLGITDSLLRVSVGLEDVKDLTDDLNQALKVASEV